MSDFTHLHLHSEFSVHDGLCRVPDLIKATAEQNRSSLAITDSMAMFGAVRQVQKCEANKIKPILGAELNISNSGKDDQPDGHIVLLVESEEGYHNLSSLLSRAQIENKDHKTGVASVKSTWLTKKATQGLFCLTGGYNGYVNITLDQQNPEIITPEATDRLSQLQKVFGERLAVELTRCMRPGEENQLHAMAQLASEMDVPVVATNDVRFIAEKDFEAHDVRQMIASGENATQHERKRPYSPEQYMKSEAQMRDLFDDIPVAVDNAIAIARRCNYRMTLGKNFLPRFTAPEGYEEYPYLSDDDPRKMTQHLNECFRKWADQKLSGPEIEALLDESRLLISESWYGLDRRWPGIRRHYLNEGLSESEIDQKRHEYDERMITELGVITSMGFPGYYLIVKDFIQWAKQQDIPVGAGRGSGAGSLVAYATDITDLDPLPYDLLFERFLNPERVSMPDFDIDFCMNRREEVIDYVAQRYGKDRVGQIATMGTMAAKMVVKDVVRALGYNHNVGDKISKMIPDEVGVSLSAALECSEELNAEYHNDDEVKEIIDLALQLEGLTRSIGKHAGGVVIAPEETTKFSPLYVESENKTPVTQFDKNDVESAGLVKFDFLGLRTLTIVHDALKHLKRDGVNIDINRIDLQDQSTFELLQSGKTIAVFQLENTGMQGMVKRLKPSCFEDVIAAVALYRPGPLQSGMVEDFIERKHGLQKVSYPHPDYQLDALKPVLEPTYGIIVYQEQVMQIAQVMAGYSLGQADLLRRAMGKKKPEEMAKQRSVFLEGCEKNNINRELAGNIFDLVEMFAGYGFNKSHSAGYGLLSYQTAYLKAHYPVQFMASVLSSEASNQDKLIHLMGEVKRLGINIKNPNVNESENEFKPVADKKYILFGLEGIKGVGDSAIKEILSERTENGRFTSFDNFIERMNGKRITSTIYSALIGSGAMDCFANGRNIMQARAEMLAKIEAEWPKKYKSYVDYQAKYQKKLEDDAKTGKNTANRLKPHFWPPKIKIGQDETGVDLYHNIEVKSSAKRHDLLLLERNALGTFISQHPFSLIEEESKRYGTHTINSVNTMDVDELRKEETPRNVRISGILSSLEYKKKGGAVKFATLKLDDGHDTIDIRVFGRELGKYKNLLEGALFQPLLLSGRVKHDRYSDSMTIDLDSVETYNNIRDKYARAICIIRKESDEKPLKSLPEDVFETLKEFNNGYSAVLVQDMYKDGTFKTYPIKTHRVAIRDELIEKLNDQSEFANIDAIKVLGAIDKDARMALDRKINKIINRSSDEQHAFNIINEAEEVIKEHLEERGMRRRALIENIESTFSM